MKAPKPSRPSSRAIVTKNSERRDLGDDLAGGAHERVAGDPLLGAGAHGLTTLVA